VNFSTHYYFPNVRFQRPPNHHFKQKIQHFSGDGTDKNATQNSPMHVISSEKKSNLSDDAAVVHDRGW